MDRFGLAVLWSEFKSGERGVAARWVVGLAVLSLVQQRWWSVAAAAQIPLAVWVTVLLGRASVSRGVRLVWALAVVAMVVPVPWFLARERAVVEARADVQKGEAMQLLYRDVAATLRAAAPDGEIVLLAFPNTSVAVGYYGGVRTVGTLYWENGDGLRAAAEALTAADDGVAERIIRARG